MGARRPFFFAFLFLYDLDFSDLGQKLLIFSIILSDTFVIYTARTGPEEEIMAGHNSRRTYRIACSVSC